jgi:RNA polymerase sigma-70 factor (ECF subfamily)
VETGKAQVTPSPEPELRPDPPSGFEQFYRTAYREVLKTAMYVGATEQEAADAAAETMEEILRRWEEIGKPLAYARRAVVNNFLKDRTRGPERIRRRLAERGEVTPEAEAGTGLTQWEDRQWVTQLLEALPMAQRVVMAFIIDGFTPAEVASLLGKNQAAIRQNLRAARQRLAQTLGHDHQKQAGHSADTQAAGGEPR